jgi:hypothetical protein
MVKILSKALTNKQCNPIRCKRQRGWQQSKGNQFYKSIMRREGKEERIDANVSKIESPSRRWLMVGLANTNRSRVLYCECVGAHSQLH